MLEEEEEEAQAGGWKEYHKSKRIEMLEEAVTMQRGQGEQEKKKTWLFEHSGSINKVWIGRDQYESI